ncbi:MAG: hypothetical protein Q9185_001390 [Variospora sp. 1 TL-2023]
MLLPFAKSTLPLLLAGAAAASSLPQQVPLRSPSESAAPNNITVELFNNLEELSRIADVAYCVGEAGLGIQKPFLCASRCQDFKHFELVKTWNTGPLLADGCGYIALSHSPSAPRVIVAFRGTYSIANAIIDLSTIPQDYVPYSDEKVDQQNKDETNCHKCMVHAGFMTSWRVIRTQMLGTLEHLIKQHPDYRLILVGHSLGGAVAALASLEFHAKGWGPQITTFGEPRVGNQALAEYIDEVFYDQTRGNASDSYRRVTHVDDLVPLLPLTQRLIRFLAKDGRVYYGDAILTPGITNIAKATHARVIRGDLFGKHDVTDQIAEVRLLLAPLAREDVKTIRCLGLNYEQHAKESRMPLPKYPVLFYKPVTALTGPFDNIPVAAPAQQVEGLDYECELVAIIGKEARDVPESKALEYVLGYAVGNDVSHREWQLKRGGGQWALGKGFDGWAPFGPGIVSPILIKDPQRLKIGTKLNGQTVQDSSTRDMIFGVAKTIAFLSQVTTLLPGDILFTGTPQGVGSGRSPPLWLNNGDVVEVSLEGIGTCTNKVEYAQSMPKL